MEEPVTLTQEEILGKNVPGGVFNSWDNIKELKRLLREVCFMPTSWECKKMESYNKKVCTLFIIYFSKNYILTFICRKGYDPSMNQVQISVR